MHDGISYIRPLQVTSLYVRRLRVIEIIVLFTFNAFWGLSTLLVDYITYYHDYPFQCVWCESEVTQTHAHIHSSSHTHTHACSVFRFNLDNKHIRPSLTRIELFFLCVIVKCIAFCGQRPRRIIQFANLCCCIAVFEDYILVVCRICQIILNIFNRISLTLSAQVECCGCTVHVEGGFKCASWPEKSRIFIMKIIFRMESTLGMFA